MIVPGILIRKQYHVVQLLTISQTDNGTGVAASHERQKMNQELMAEEISQEFESDFQPLASEPVDPPSGFPQREPLPPQMQKTTDTIGGQISDISRGTVSGSFPAVERMMQKTRSTHTHNVPEGSPEWMREMCTPDCEMRRAAEFGGRRNLIQDVYPSIPERLYGLQRDVDQLNKEFRDHKEESIRAGENRVSREKFDDFKEDVDKELKIINNKLDRRTGWLILQTAALIASTAYALILSYKHFIQP